MSRTFDGNGSLEFGDGNYTVVTGVPMTMCGWAYRTTGALNSAVMAISDTAGAVNYFMLFLSSADTVVTQVRDVVGAENASAGDLAVNTWGHVAFVGDSANYTTYLDGVAGTPISIGRSPVGTDNLSIGRLDHDGAAFAWTGRVFWPAVYNTNLSANDILMLAKGADPHTIRRDALVTFPELLLDEDVDLISHTNLTVTGTGHGVHNTLPPNVRLLGRRGRVRSRIPQLI